MNARSSLFLSSLSVLLALAPMAALHADETAPMFGGTSLSIHDDTYTWDSATEDGTWHYDIYINSSGQSVTVTGIINSSLAAVSSTDLSGVVDGYLQNGVYGDTTQSYSEVGSYTQNGYTFTNYSVDSIAYVDLMSGQLLTEGSNTYSGGDGTDCYTWDAMGNWSWYQNVSGSTSSSSASGPSDLSIFDTTYSFASGSTSWAHLSSESSDGTNNASNDSTGYTDHYVSSDGSWLDLTYTTTDYGGGTYTETVNISGWDYYAGNFSASDPYQSGSFVGFENVTWEGRTTATFAPAQLWVDGTLVNWQQGVIDSTGNITDTYTDGGSISLVVSGSMRSFSMGASSVSVVVNDTGVGSFTNTSDITQSGAGFDIQYNQPNDDPDPNPTPSTYDTPFFCSTITSLWVDGTEYLFSQGYDDGYSNRTDTYSNPSAGDLTLYGNTGDPDNASFTLSYYGGPDSGTYAGGSFYGSSHVISTTQPPPVLLGPDAFWVRGQFYSRVSSESNDFQCSAGYTLTVSSADDGSTLDISGADALSTYSGSCSNGQAGAFLLQNDEGQSNVVAVAANANGSLQLSGQTRDADCPPAVMVTGGGIWQYLGTVPLNDVDTLVYGNALDASTDSGQFLAIDPDGVVTLTDYVANVILVGSYSRSSHLFQAWSDGGGGLPMPLYGVNPCSNHRLWHLATPDSAAGPATFIVGGAVWHYTGTDEDGNALYQGYYNGQTLSLGAAGADGQLMTVTVGGVSSFGTLNDVRGSARLRDGTVVYSGDMNGLQVQPTLNENHLYTIAADLDITGDVITFGALSGNAAAAGVTLEFQDAAIEGGSFMASFHSMLARPDAQWQWARAADSSGQTTLPVMKLDAGSRLTLYDTAGTGQAGVVLDPAGASSFKGPVRVLPAGDLPMDFHEGPQP